MTISESSEERAPRRAEIEKAGGHEATAIGPLPTNSARISARAAAFVAIVALMVALALDCRENLLGRRAALPVGKSSCAAPTIVAWKSYATFEIVTSGRTCKRWIILA